MFFNMLTHDLLTQVASRFIFEDSDFENYCLARLEWKISLTSFKLAYLFEKHLNNNQKYSQDPELFLFLIQRLESLIDECDDLNIILSMEKRTRTWEFWIFSLLAVATQAVNTYIENKPDSEHQQRLLKLLEKIYLKAPLTATGLYPRLTRAPEEKAIETNDIDTLKIIFPFIRTESREKIFKNAVSSLNIPLIKSIIAYESLIKPGKYEFKYQEWLETIGAWPLIEKEPSTISSIHNDLSVKKDLNSEMNVLIESLHAHFPVDNDSSIFNLLFPFSNEYEYDQVLTKLTTMDKLIKMGALQIKDQERIKVGVLFGESHFLSLLSGLSNYLDLVVLADVEPRQHKHVQHMLDCLNQANSPEEYIQAYLTNNPILNEPLGSRRLSADIPYLTRNIEGGGSCGSYYFLSNPEQFNACKEAAKKLSFVVIKLDLTNVEKCNQLSALLKQHNAIIKLCNLTNIHHYDDYETLDKSTLCLLRDTPDCLVMYALGQLSDLKTTISKGLSSYFSHCLNKTYSDIKVTDLIDENMAKNTSSSILPSISKHPIHNRGFFSTGLSQSDCSAPRAQTNSMAPF